MYFVSIILTIFTVFYIWLRKLPNRQRVCVVVLGDIGRSPRMQYHALSFIKEKFLVDLVGYGGSTPIEDLLKDDSVQFHFALEPPAIQKKLPRICGYAFKALWQSLVLFIQLLMIKRPEFILLQNPPSIPSIFVVWFVCRLRSSTFVMDWHNYGYTIMALSLGDNNRLVKFSKWYEHFFAKKADANICVTNAMKSDLKENWGVNAVTHYDRPPHLFKKANIEEQHKLFMKLSKTYDIFQARSTGNGNGIERTSFTIKRQGDVARFLPCRPALLVSSTSWTEDEDFAILLNALDKYENICRESTKKSPSGSQVPHISCVITGKGPMKEHYLKEISTREWTHVEICTPWLEPEDYPVLLGSCDLGVCLHTSSSGLDLPMKVVDMFGSGLPVCAVCFKCLPELVKHGENGMIFHCANELSQQIEELLNGFPDKCLKLGKYRENIKDFQAVRWHDSWKKNVLPIFS